MKRDETSKRPRKTQGGRRAEYRFDYAKARSNRFADRMKNGAVAVILDPDVAAVFGSSQQTEGPQTEGQARLLTYWKDVRLPKRADHAVCSRGGL
jgi:hypothetical protein